MIAIDAVAQQLVGALLTANWDGKTARVRGHRRVRRSQWPRTKQSRYVACRIRTVTSNVCSRRKPTPRPLLCSRARSSWRRYPSASCAFSSAEGAMVANTPAQIAALPNNTITISNKTRFSSSREFQSIAFIAIMSYTCPRNSTSVSNTRLLMNVRSPRYVSFYLSNTI